MSDQTSDNKHYKAAAEQTMSSTLRPASKGALLTNGYASTCNCSANLADNSTINLMPATIAAPTLSSQATALPANTIGSANQMQQPHRHQYPQQPCCNCPVNSSVDKNKNKNSNNNNNTGSSSSQPSQKQAEKELPGGKHKATVPIRIIVEPRSDDSVRCDCRNCQFFSGWCCMPCALFIIIVIVVFWLSTKLGGSHSDHKDLNKTIANATKGALTSMMRSSQSQSDVNSDKLDEIETIY